MRKYAGDGVPSCALHKRPTPFPTPPLDYITPPPFPQPKFTLSSSVASTSISQELPPSSRGSQLPPHVTQRPVMNFITNS
ncbi:hypothetical protein QVD17_22065 [Tagetes erecta]|uniref:Uncharacterized protein n=1 Tax=Tagetes erecta TaxID=13708 RepID=A0AAD8NTC9_TARER|nr:hypothetical protein QVD17_22065 [Tagetes erecta]